MPVWRLQSSFGVDTAFVRDHMVITPHFNDQGPGSDPQALCDDLANGYDTLFDGFSGEISVKAYDAQGTVPVYPAGETVLRPGAFEAFDLPREIACCLSFFSVRNSPSQRGRLYIPVWILETGKPGLRPPGGMSKMTALVTLFSDLGGVDVDWSVYSRKLDQAFGITNWWYDNEWDVVRSRGLRGDSRTQGTVSEG